jgi:hypothetical protein
MAGKNPYAGQYAPSIVKLGKEDLIKGLKGVPKMKFPNKHMTTTGYKQSLKKVEEGKS